MRRYPIFLAVIASLLPVTAVAAEWRQVAEYDLDPKSEMFVQRAGLAGPIEHLQLQAEGGDAHCLSVRANFRNGETRVIFTGEVPQDKPVILPFEGGDSSIRQLRLRCSSPEQGQMRLLADIGRFSGEWSGDSTLERAWSAASNLGSTLFHDWQLVATGRFGSRYDDSRMEAPDGPVAALALRPVGRDARCRAGTVLLANGESRKLDLDRNDFLPHDRYYRLDVPAASQLEAIDLECRATNGARVAIQLFASS